MRVNFKLRNSTPGALRYEEVDDTGKVLTPKDGAKIGTLYIRKDAFTGGHQPATLSIEVTYNALDRGTRSSSPVKEFQNSTQLQIGDKR